MGCRLCNSKEKIAHCGCSGLVESQYYARHDAMMHLYFSKLLFMLGFEADLEPWSRSDSAENVKKMPCLHVVLGP